MARKKSASLRSNGLTRRSATRKQDRKNAIKKSQENG